MLIRIPRQTARFRRSLSQSLSRSLSQSRNQRRNDEPRFSKLPPLPSAVELIPYSVNCQSLYEISSVHGEVDDLIIGLDPWVDKGELSLLAESKAAESADLTPRGLVWMANERRLDILNVSQRSRIYLPIRARATKTYSIHSFCRCWLHSLVPTVLSFQLHCS